MFDLVPKVALAPLDSDDRFGQGVGRKRLASEGIGEIGCPDQRRRQRGSKSYAGPAQRRKGTRADPNSMRKAMPVFARADRDDVRSDRGGTNGVPGREAAPAVRAVVAGRGHDHTPEVDDSALGGDRQRVAVREVASKAAVAAVGVPRKRSGAGKAEIQDVHFVRDRVVDRGDDRSGRRFRIDARGAADLVNAEIGPRSHALERARRRIDPSAGCDHGHGGAVAAGVPRRLVVGGGGLRQAGIPQAQVAAHGDDLAVREAEMFRPPPGIARQRGQRIVLERFVVEVEPGIDDRDPDAFAGRSDSRGPKPGLGEFDDLRDA